MSSKFPNKITYKQFWNIYSKSFLYFEISFLTLQILSWRYPINAGKRELLYGEDGEPLMAIGRSVPDLLYHDEWNLIEFVIFLFCLVFIPFLYTLTRRRVRDMEIDSFFTFVFYLPLLILFFAGLSVFHNSVELFLKQCCNGAWINNVYYSNPVSGAHWFHIGAFAIIISLLYIPYLIMVRTKD